VARSTALARVARQFNRLHDGTAQPDHPRPRGQLPWFRPRSGTPPSRMATVCPAHPRSTRRAAPRNFGFETRPATMTGS
jgi:hypothetical protein